MQPNQNPYDFLNTPTPKRSFGGATTQKGRIIQVVIAAAVLILVFSLVFSFVFSNDSGPKKPLLEVSAAQADIIALTKDGDINLRDSSLKAKNTMIRFTATSHNTDTKAILVTYGVGKDAAKQSKPYQDTTYTEQLKKALENNAYDATYQKILADKLGVYRAKLNNAYGAISSTKQKTEISNFFNQLELLAPSTTKQ